MCRIFQHPTGMRTLHIWLAGGSLKAVREDLYPVVEAWGQAMGCHRMTATGRRGWLRALDGWVEQGTLRVKPLVDERRGALIGMVRSNEVFMGLASELDP